MPLMYNAVGGSTIHWSAHFPRFHPSDFRVRSLDGVADDWPLDYDELEPYYDLNDRMIGVSGLAGDPGNPPRSPRQTPPLPLGRVRRDAGAAASTGSAGTGGPPTRRSSRAPYGEGRGSLQQLRPLRPRLPDRRAVERGRHLLAAGAAPRRRAADRCRVREITVDGTRPGRGAALLRRRRRARASRPRRWSSSSPATAIGTPRLLLNSRSRHFPDGLANRSGLVGKRPDVPPVRGRSPASSPSRSRATRGRSARRIFSHEFYETDASRGFVRGYQLQVVPAARPARRRRSAAVLPRIDPGAPTTTRLRRAASAHGASLGVIGRICRTSRTRSRSTPT